MLATIGPAQGSPLEVLRVFLKLGLTSFGGPVAHLAYFREEFVEKRRWMSDEAYSDTVALCQFLPGPSSSQVGMAIGQMRAGGWGMLAAWAGFTLPSAVALMLFAWGLSSLDPSSAVGWIHGLKIAAVAVVAHAVVGMARSLAPDLPRALLAIGAAAVVLVSSGPLGQVLALIGAGVAGLLLLKSQAAQSEESRIPNTPSVRVGFVSVALLGLLLAAGPLLAIANPGTLVPLFDGVFRTGALVFGGGHVVLPFLETTFVASEALQSETFLAGYGAAQAIPGPLFAFSAFIGASLTNDWTRWILGFAFLATMFAPAFLTLIGALPFWSRLKAKQSVRRALTGVNAGVVGILGAALYDPVWKSAIFSIEDFAIALFAFIALTFTKTPPVFVVAVCALLGWFVR